MSRFLLPWLSGFFAGSGVTYWRVRRLERPVSVLGADTPREDEK